MAKSKQQTDPRKRRGSRFVSVQKGNTRLASADMKFPLYTQPGHENGGGRDPAGNLGLPGAGWTLAQHGFGEVIGDVNEIINQAGSDCDQCC